jgi:hypothetical protein
VTGPLILIVFVAGGDADSPALRAMLRATGDAVATGTRVVVRDMSEAPSDAGVVALEASSHADAVAELRWSDRARREALLRVHVAPAGPWVERTVRFASEDADAERGRALGFALASALPEGALEREQKPESAAPAPPAPPAASAKDAAAAPPFAPPAPTEARPDRPVRLAVGALTAFGIPGLSGGIGGEVAAEWRALGSLGFRAAAGVIGGSGSEALASATTVRFATGLAWHPLRTSRTSESRRWDISVAADGVAEQLSVTYVAPDSASSTRARWLFGVGVSVDLRWLFASNLEAVAGIGVDDVFSPTYVLVQDVPAATFPAVHGIGRLGLGMGF